MFSTRAKLSGQQIRGIVGIKNYVRSQGLSSVKIQDGDYNYDSRRVSHPCVQNLCLNSESALDILVIIWNSLRYNLVVSSSVSDSPTPHMQSTTRLTLPKSFASSVEKFFSRSIIISIFIWVFSFF